MPRASPETMTKPASRKIAREGACEFQPGAGGVARADDREHRPHQRVKRAAHAEQRRRIVERRQPRRIAGFLRRQQADADLRLAASSARGLVLAADPARPIGAAAACQIGQALAARRRRCRND